MKKSGKTIGKKMRRNGEMVTGYKLNFEKVRVNTIRKADRIISTLRKQGRHAYFEPLTVSIMKEDYIVFYWPVRGVI